MELKAGDTVQAIMAKINDSGAAVKAKLDPLRSSLAPGNHDDRISSGSGTHRMERCSRTWHPPGQREPAAAEPESLGKDLRRLGLRHGDKASGRLLQRRRDRSRRPGTQGCRRCPRKHALVPGGHRSPGKTPRVHLQSSSVGNSGYEVDELHDRGPGSHRSHNGDELLEYTHKAALQTAARFFSRRCSIS